MKPQQPLVRLREAELAPDAGATLFLGRLDEASLRGELTGAGIVSGLANRGYRALRIEIGREDNEHRLVVRAQPQLAPLIELRCVEEVVLAKDLAPRPVQFEVLSVLSIRWLLMQDPSASFTVERPQLPGQRHPGLGLARRLVQRVHGWARDWGKDAVVNFPEFFHNAVFYSALYRFMAAERQGQFEALERDLGSLPLAEASAALLDGRVVRDPGGESVTWEAAEMLAPLSPSARDWLRSPAFTAAVVRERERCRYRLRSRA